MSKKDIKALIVGAVSLFLACFLGIITIALFAIQIGTSAAEFDWNSAFSSITETVDSMGG